MNEKTAKTSLNQVSELNKFIVETRGGFRIFDFGAGVDGVIDSFMEKNRIRYYPYDPFNRKEAVNNKSLKYLEKGGVQLITCSNVLNIIDDEHLEETINQLVEYTKLTTDGELWVSVYYNPKKGKYQKRNGYVQRNTPIHWYSHLFQKYGDVEQVKGFLKAVFDK